MIKGSGPYRGDVTFLKSLLRRGWHTDAAPSEIDWIRVTALPRPIPKVNGKRILLSGHMAFEPAAVIWLSISLRVPISIGMVERCLLVE